MPYKYGNIFETEVIINGYTCYVNEMIETILRKAIKYIQFYCGFQINNLFTCNLKLMIQGKITIPGIGMRYNNIVYYLLINQYADYILTHIYSIRVCISIYLYILLCIQGLSHTYLSFKNSKVLCFVT